METQVKKAVYNESIPHKHTTGEYMSIGRTASVAFLVALAFLVVFSGFPGTSAYADKSANQQKSPYADAEIAIEIIPSVNETFGYDILLHGKPLVHQPNIPALPGKEGFTSREKAQAVAELVVRKIRNNGMPPAVTIEELNSIGALR